MIQPLSRIGMRHPFGYVLVLNLAVCLFATTSYAQVAEPSISELHDLVNNNPAQAASYSATLFNRARATNRPQLQIEAQLIHADALSNLGQQHRAMNVLRNVANDHPPPSPNLRARALCQLATVYRRRGILDSAQALLIPAETIASQQHDTALFVQIQLELASIALLAGEPNTARLHLATLRGNPQLEQNRALAARYAVQFGRTWHLLAEGDSMRLYWNRALTLAHGCNNLQVQADCYLAMAKLGLRNGHPARGIAFIDSAEAIAHLVNSPQIFSQCALHRAYAQQAQGAMDSAVQLTILADSLALRCENNWQHVNARLAKGMYQSWSNKQGAALEEYYDVLEQCQKLGYKRSEVECLAQLAFVYRFSGELEQSGDLAQQAVALARSYQLVQTEGHVLRELALSGTYQRNFELSIASRKRALSIARKLQNPLAIMNNQANLALQYYFAAGSNHGWATMDSALAVSKSIPDFYSRVLSGVYLEAGQIFRLTAADRSIQYLTRALELNEGSDLPAVTKYAYTWLRITYSTINDFEQALHWQMKLNTLKDSLAEEKMKETLVELHIEFETKQKDQQLKSLAQQQELQALKVHSQQATLNRTQNQLIALLLMLGGIAGLALLLFNRYRLRQQAATLRLDNARIQLENQQLETNKKLELEAWRTRFFTEVSHELRTPLTLIRGPLEELLSSGTNVHTAHLKVMHKNTMRLLNLVNQTLDLEKLERGHMRLKLRKTNIESLVRSTLQAFEMLAINTNISLTHTDVSTNLHAMLDAPKIETVLINLLANAFRHTPVRGRISVEILQKEEQLRLTVNNSGSALQSDQLAHIFTRFYSNADNRGTGIGLALSKELVELHGGTIEASNTAGGVAFAFSVPMVRAGAVHELPVVTMSKPIQHPPMAGETDAAQPMVLVVEDDADVRNYLTQLLQTNFSIITATNGREALNIAQHQPLDLIVSDVMMPEMDGNELTRTLKTELATSHIPIILLTARASIEQRITGLETGADDYVAKPFHPEELQTRMRNLIQQRRTLRQLFATNALQQPATATSNKLDAAFLEKAHSIVKAQLDNSEFTVEQFCTELALNRTSVHLKLKALTGKSASGFIRDIRLERAAELVRAGEQPMTAIATLTGFGTRQSFNKAFKARFGVTPSEYSRI